MRLASALARGDEVPRAITLVRDGLAEIPPGRPFLLDRVFCELRASEVARESGNSGADVAHTQSAERLLRESGLGSELANLNVALHLAESFRAAGRNTEASAAFESAFAQLAALGETAPRWPARCSTTGGCPAICWGNHGKRSGCSGSPWRSAALTRPAPASPRCCSTTWPVRSSSRAGAEALAIAEKAAAEAVRLGNDVSRVQSMLLRATAYRETGDLAHATGLLDEFERLQTDRLPPTHVAFSALASERALLEEARRIGRGHRRRGSRRGDCRGQSQGRELLARGLVRRATWNSPEAGSRRR